MILEYQYKKIQEWLDKNCRYTAMEAYSTYLPHQYSRPWLHTLAVVVAVSKKRPKHICFLKDILQGYNYVFAASYRHKILHYNLHRSMPRMYTPVVGVEVEEVEEVEAVGVVVAVEVVAVVVTLS